MLNLIGSLVPTAAMVALASLLGLTLHGFLTAVSAAVAGVTTLTQ